ncbi:MAG: 16S rRNA (adenine(1518)-N(6)/adenine(1519)-N(6))-dimethyltransferase RsmA [Rhodospirillales bacterium]|nr:16S rRNA (adenine(1518)-N(6)/adenine(1519)-N(6))-dimethyltransferase RsmA [Rhodospirillales bacterium]
MAAPEPPVLPPLRTVIRDFGLGARKSLGQHFLLDLNLCARIARSAGDLTQATVFEIGPGPGGLTRALLDAGAARVIAIERDARCVEAFRVLSEAYGDRAQVVAADALKTDLAELAPAPRRIVANLPYNVGTPLLIGWLKRINDFEGLTLMFQKEVADRLAAEPRSKDYGRLSVITQWLCEVRPDFNVAKTAFTPPPKVASTVVSLTPRPAPLAPAPWEALETVTAAAFGQRRKMIRSSLKKLGLDLEALGLDPTQRAEELSVEQFCAIARAL